MNYIYGDLENYKDLPEKLKSIKNGFVGHKKINTEQKTEDKQKFP